MYVEELLTYREFEEEERKSVGVRTPEWADHLLSDSLLARRLFVWFSDRLCPL